MFHIEEPIIMNVSEINELNKGGDIIVDKIDINTLDWTEISSRKLTQNFIRRFHEKIEWYDFFINKDNHILDEEFVEFLISETDCVADLILTHVNLSMDFINKHLDKFDLYFLPYRKDFDIEFYEKHVDEIDFVSFSTFYQLTPEFIIRFKDRIDWMGASVKQEFTVELLDEVKEFVDWGIITHRYVEDKDIMEYIRKMSVGI